MVENRRENSKSIARSIIHNFSSWVLPLALSFIATPIIVKWLGHGDYGIYSLAISFIAYSFNFNVGRAITKYVAEYRVAGESRKISEVISATLFINLAVGAVGVIAIIALADFFVVDVLKIPPEAHDKTAKALNIAALTIFFLMLYQVFTAILQGVHRFDVFARISNLNSISLILGNLLLALSGFGLIALLIWNLFVTAASAAFTAISAKQLLPEFSLNFKFGREMLKLVFKYSSAIIVYQILANVLTLFERSWITGRLGSESLTFYVIPMMLASYIHAFFANLLLVMFPLASELKDEPERLVRLYQKATKVVSFLAIFIAASLVVESRHFLTLWMGADFAEKSSPILIALAISYSFLAINIVAWQLTEGLGYPKYNSYLTLISFIITVTGMIWMMEDYGSFGVALARSIGFIFLFLSTFYVEKVFLGKIQVKFWSKLLIILFISTALAAVVESYLSSKLGIGWFSLIFSGFAGGVVYCVTAWFLGFLNDDEIKLLKELSAVNFRMGKKFELVQRVGLIKKACAGKRVLHLGCTNHPYTERSIEHDILLHFELKKVARELYGFDFDQEGLDRLKSEGGNNLFRVDLQKLDELELDETFDVIIAGEIIEHLSNPGLFLQGIKRFMNQDTQLIITTVNAYFAVRFLIYVLRGKGGENEPVHPDHVAYYSYKTLSMLLERENLDIKMFCFYDIGSEHRRYNRWFYNVFNDICVKIYPQLSDGIIAICNLK